MAKHDHRRAEPPTGATVAEFADRLPVGLFLTDEDGRCLYVNQPWCELSGLTWAQARDRGWDEAVHPGTTCRPCDAPGSAWRKARIASSWSSASLAPSGVPNGARPRARRAPPGRPPPPLHRHGHRAHRPARAHTTLLTQLVDRISDMIIVLDAAGTVRWVNNRAALFLGRSRAECFGVSVLELIHPEDRASVAERLTAATRQARGTRRPGSSRHPSAPAGAGAADGEYRDVECVATNLLDEPSVRGVVIVARDLTERETLERRVDELERAFTTAFRYSPVGRAIVGLDGRWLEVNEALTTMLGRTAEELIGTAGIDAVHPDDRAVPPGGLADRIAAWKHCTTFSHRRLSVGPGRSAR